MTQKQVIKWWNEIEAFKNGKEIEMKQNCDEWVINRNPMFTDEFEYRVKPEPKYVPFTFEDAEFLIGKVIKTKSGKVIKTIVGVSPDGVDCGNTFSYFNHLLHHYTFLDGSPCGKLENQ